MTNHQRHNFNQLLIFIRQPMMLQYVRNRGFPLNLNVNNFFLFYFFFLAIYCLLKYSEFFFLKLNKNVKHLFVQRSLNQEITQKILLKNQKFKYKVIRCKNIRVGFFLFNSFFKLMKKNARNFIRLNRPQNLYQLRELISYYIGSNIIELNKKIKSITFGNDHQGLEVGLVNQAIKANIKTIYRQHAYVNKYFPQLKLDKYILFDKFSAKIYGLSKSKYILICKKSFLKINLNNFKILENDNKHSIGIATTSIPNISEMISLCNKLSVIYKISIRLHASTFDEVLRKIPNKFKHLVTRKKLDKWIESVDYVIAGNSGILLDSILHGKPCFYYSKLDFFSYDYYNFIKYGFVPKLSLIKKLKLHFNSNFYTQKWKKYVEDQLITASCVRNKSLLSIYD